MSSPEHWADSQLRNVGTVILHLLIDSSRLCPLPLRIGGRWATQVPEAYDARGQTDQLLGPRCFPGALRVCGHEGTQIGKVSAAAHAVRSAARCSWTSAPPTVPPMGRLQVHSPSPARTPPKPGRWRWTGTVQFRDALHLGAHPIRHHHRTQSQQKPQLRIRCRGALVHPRWYDHDEAVSRLEALRRAWEEQ